MHALAKLLVAAVALDLSAGAAFAGMGETKTDAALRAEPAAQSELLLNIPSGAVVSVSLCSRDWRGVTWNSYAGYVRESGLLLHQASASAGPPSLYAPYPYRAGHYPTVDAYYDLPPYADINPSYYRGRCFLTLREHNRYRYVPHVFHGSEDAYAK